MAVGDFFEEVVVCGFGELAGLVEFRFSFIDLAHRAVHAAQAPVDIDVIWSELLRCEQFPQGIVVAAGIVVDNAEVEVNEGDGCVLLLDFFEKGQGVIELVELQIGVGQVEAGLDVVRIVG